MWYSAMWTRLAGFLDSSVTALLSHCWDVLFWETAYIWFVTSLCSCPGLYRILHANNFPWLDMSIWLTGEKDGRTFHPDSRTNYFFLESPGMKSYCQFSNSPWKPKLWLLSHLRGQEYKSSWFLILGSVPCLHLYCSSSCTAWCSCGCLFMWLFRLFMLVVAKSQLQHL